MWFVIRCLLFVNNVFMNQCGCGNKMLTSEMMNSAKNYLKVLELSRSSLPKT